MAWNGSDGGASRQSQGGTHEKKATQGGTESRRSRGVARPYWRGLLALALVMVGGGLAWWWVVGRGGHAGRAPLPDDKRPASRIASAEPKTTVSTKKDPLPLSNSTRQKEPLAAPAVPDGMVAVTNAGKVLFMTPKEAETFRRACRDTTLRTKTEKRLRLLASIPIGSPVPPMPGFVDMDADLQATLDNKIEILPDDTAREIEQKKFVMAFKEYMAEEIAAGKTANQVYEEYVQTMNKVAALTSEGSKMAREMRGEGDLEGAKKFLERVNAKIEEMGGNPIDLDRRPKGMSGKSKEQ